MSARRFIPISESVIALAIKIAEREGIPLREFIERVLNEVLKSMQYRSNVTEVLALSDLMDDLRRMGGALLPSDIVYRLIDSMNEDLYNELLNTMRRLASWYGMLVRVKRGTTIEALKLVLSMWFPDTNVNIAGEGNKVFRVIVSSPKYSERLTKVLEIVVRELCESMGLKIKELGGEVGIIKAVIEVI
ncbi:MAG TPA: hypothetical protein ENG05_03580 [Acidilobales archaeon]|nr:hypothetical protein [Acidilobales archaeon]